MSEQNMRVRPAALLPSRTGEEWGAASHASIRQSNLALVAAALFESGGGLSRADVATQTGLTKATVSRLVSELLQMGIAEAGVPEDSASAGRPATPLYPAENTLVGIGLEVNVDRISGAAIDLRGNVLATFEEEVDLADSGPADGLGKLSKKLVQMLQELGDRGISEVVGVSLAIPGVVDQETQTVAYAPNLGWRDVAPREFLAETLGEIPFVVDNDANLQALAVLAVDTPEERRMPESYLYLTGDIGIGGSVIRNGIPIRGPRGRAGEIGHTTIQPDGPTCHCGSRGCLERYAGKGAMAEAAGVAFGDVLVPPPDVLVNELENNNPKAKAAVERAGWALGIALANATNLLDVDTVVLGTSLAPLMPWLLPNVKKEMELRVVGSSLREVELVAAPPVALPAAMGGGILAMQQGLASRLAVGDRNRSGSNFL